MAIKLLSTLPWTDLITIIGGSSILYLSLLSIYRIFLHPLSKFPGDTLASITQWHWDWHAPDSEYLPRLHEKHGPVVRIGPNELHFSDPKVYSEIYHSGTTFTKDPAFYASFKQDESTFGFCDPQEAKIRKDILSPLFSRRAILRLESVVQDEVDTLVTQILSYKDHPVDLYHAFRSVSLDVISGYCFAKSFEALKYPSFKHPILLAMDESPTMLWIGHALPALVTFLMMLPESIFLRMNPRISGFLLLRANLDAQIDRFLKDPSSLERADHEIIYHHLLKINPSKGQHSLPTKKSLSEEAALMMLAGSDTVGNAVTRATFYTLSDKTIHARLYQELCNVWPEKDAPIGLDKLEKLPYLTAIIKEGLRISCGVVSPMPRIVGPTDAKIGGAHVPAGTIVSNTVTFVHYDPTIFPDPWTFDPERWLQAGSKELESYLIPFSRGPRSCLGINLAWCELYLILANVFRKLDMEIHNTTVDDFKYRAYFTPVFTGNSFHARVQERN